MRSEVMDRLGIEARSSGTGAAAPLDPLEQFGGEYAALSPIWQIGVLVGEAVAPESQLGGLHVTTFDGLSGQLDATMRTFPTFRREFGGQSGIPVVLLAGLEVTPEAAGPPSGRLVLDALHVPAASPQDAVEAAHDAQAILAAEQMILVATGEVPATLGSAGAVFDAARRDAIPLSVLGPGDTPQVPGASGQALMRMNIRLEDGFRLVTPSTAPSVDGITRTAWYVIDPSTGLVRDEHESGRHVDISEEAGEQGEAASLLGKARKLVCTLGNKWNMAVVIFGSLLALGGEPGAAHRSARGAGRGSDEGRGVKTGSRGCARSGLCRHGRSERAAEALTGTRS